MHAYLGTQSLLAFTTLRRFNLPLHQLRSLALAACPLSFSSQYLGICNWKTSSPRVMKLHLHFCSNQHGYPPTPKITKYLLPLRHTISLGKLSPKSPLTQPFMIRDSVTRDLSEVNGHQYGHSQTPRLSQVFGNTDNAVTTTYTFNRKVGNSKHRVITRQHLF